MPQDSPHLRSIESCSEDQVRNKICSIAKQSYILAQHPENAQMKKSLSGLFNLTSANFIAVAG
jgi:hypothetical protein